MTFTIDSNGVTVFLLTLMTLLAGPEATGYLQVLDVGTTNKIIAVLGLAGIVVKAASFAFSKAKPSATDTK